MRGVKKGVKMQLELFRAAEKAWNKVWMPAGWI